MLEGHSPWRCIHLDPPLCIRQGGLDIWQGGLDIWRGWPPASCKSLPSKHRYTPSWEPAIPFFLPRSTYLGGRGPEHCAWESWLLFRPHLPGEACGNTSSQVQMAGQRPASAPWSSEDQERGLEQGRPSRIPERWVHLAGEASPGDPLKRNQELSRKIIDAGLLIPAG